MLDDGRSPDDFEDSYLLERRFGDETSPTVAIIETLATIENVPVTKVDEKFEPSFHDCYDAEALNTVVSNVTASGELFVELSFDTYRIRVDDSQQIRIWEKHECESDY